MRHERTDRVPYRAWNRENWVTITDGAVVDYDAVTECVDEFCDAVGSVPDEDCFDPYNATHYMTILAKKSNRTPVEVSQTMLTLSEPTNRLRELIVSGKVVHDNNPLLSWALGNAYAVTDTNENIKLSKRNKDDSQRIDPVAAIINAMSRLPQAVPKRSKYEDDELLEL